jgi:hypothetical protein
MRRTALLAALATAGALAGLAPPAGAQQPATSLIGGRFSDCFWRVGVINGRTNNIAYPDAGANYWAAVYTLPPGASLRVRGTFPRARYASLNAYNGLGAVQDALADVQIDPDAGSRNPFRPRVRRDAAKRAFTVELSPGALPGAPDPDQRSNAPRRNVLLTGAANADGRAVVLWRVYVPDRGRDLRGGVPLPRPSLTLADGRVLTGKAACDALGSATPSAVDPSSLLITREQYEALRYRPGRPAYFPAEPTPVWRVQYNRAYLLALWSGEVFPNPPKSGQAGFFPNLHNQYVRAALHRTLGRVVALRGKMATTPRTYAGGRFLASTQLRYQSFCMNESPLTTRVMDCVYDEQVPLRRGRRYVVVTSRAADRPRNATARCGVAWIRWSARGDGGRDPDFGWMQVRNMLPAPGFRPAIQSTRTPGDEAGILGPYLPRARYYDGPRAFERLGCPVR